MITVEDFNSVLKEYGGSNFYHCIDTSKIHSINDFSDVNYDFCEVSRSTSGSNITYTFKVVNSAWTGGYWVCDANGDWLNITGTYSSGTKTITIVTDEPTIKLYLYICNICTNFKFERLEWIVLDLNTAPKLMKINGLSLAVWGDYYLKILNPNFSMGTIHMVSGNESVFTELHPTLVDENLYKMGIQGANFENVGFFTNDIYPSPYSNIIYLDFVLKKQPVIFKLSKNSLELGKVNTVDLNYTNLENIIDKGIVYYNNKENSFNWADKKIEIDLTDTLDLKPLSVDITLNPKKYVTSLGKTYIFYGWDYHFVLDCVYSQITSISDLINECDDGGATIVELGANLTLTSDLIVSHNITILGDDHSINLDGHSIIVDSDVKLVIENCDLSNGDNAIVQQVNSELNLDEVTFTNCESSEYSNLGSCIYCDVDLDSLSVEDDFKTVLTGCEFYDNHNAIFHGGNLIINGCKLHNTDLDYLDKHNVAFLYQTDGTANIKNSILDIDYTDTDLCTDEESIGFAQCLVQCGQTAKINNQTYSDLKDKGMDLTSNACHIFAKYYYPTLSGCVFTSPILGKEDKAFCYSLSGLNKIFKENVQITKASDNAENTNRKIEW